MAGPEKGTEGRISRRELVKRAGVGAGGLVLSGATAQPIWARPRVEDAANSITIGFVSPRSGPLAGFGEPDPYVLGLARASFAKGLVIRGKKYSVKVL